MAVPKTFTFGDFKVVAGATPGATTFVAPCGFTARSLKLTATAEETMVPDCLAEDAPAWPDRDISSLSAAVNGQGVTTTDNAPFWRSWFLAGESRPVRVGPINRALSDDGGYWQGNAVLTNLEEGATKGKKVSLTVDIASDGPWTWVPATA